MVAQSDTNEQLSRTVPYTTYQHEREARIKAEQERDQLAQTLKWHRNLRKIDARIMSPSQKATLCTASEAIEQGTPNQDGFILIESWKLGKQSGQGKATILNNLKYAETLGMLKRKKEPYYDEAGNRKTRLYIKPTPLLAHPEQVQTPDPRNHGGKRQTCPDCGSDRIQKRVICTCKDCGRVIRDNVSDQNHQHPKSEEGGKSQFEIHDLEQETENPIEQQEEQTDNSQPDPEFQFEIHQSKETSQPQEKTESWTEQQRKKPATDPEQNAKNSNGEIRPDLATDPEQTSTKNPTESKFQFEIPDPETKNTPEKSNLTRNRKTPSANQVTLFSPEDKEPTTPPMATFRLAAELLLDIAGTHPEHIRMNPKEGKKYYTNAEPLTLRHVAKHLNGKYTYGARIDHADGTTRASIYDADSATDIGRVRTAALKLQAAGYKPIIELSPLGKAHLILIYTAHVQAKAARRHECEIAPELKDIKEYWPSLAANKVRLPAGRYRRLEMNDWCKLYDADGNQLAQDGAEAASILLEYQTSAELIPDYPPEPEPETRNHKLEARDHKPTSESGVDDYHRQKYQNSRMWVEFTPQQLADWYNSRHTIDDLLPREKNGQALAWWRGERTASVAFTRDGEGWVDFGATAQRSDGKRDGGDALELATRMNAQEKATFMREVGQALNRELSREILRVARSGEQPAADVAARMTPQGWRVYHQNRESAGHAPLANADPVRQSRQKDQPERKFQIEIQGTGDTAGGVVGFSNDQGLSTLEQKQMGEGMSKDWREAGALFGRGVDRLGEGEQLSLVYDGPISPPRRPTFCCGSVVWRWNPERGNYDCGGCSSSH